MSAAEGSLGSASSEDLSRVFSALETLQEGISGRIYLASGEQLTGAWGEELTKQRGFNAAQRKEVTAGPTVTPHRLGLTVETGGRQMFGEPLTRAFEFGTSLQQEFRTYTRRSPKGTMHKVTRRFSAQMPTRSRTGWIAYPAADKYADRAINMYMEIIVKTAWDAIDGGR